MLTAHVELPFNQFHYDADTDFSTTQDADKVLIVKPRTDDARNAYRILQHAINRTSRILKLPLINENGVLDAATFRALFAIANSPAVVTKAQPLITDLTRGMTYDSFIMLGPFRTPLVGPALITHINTSLLDLAKRARLWGSLLSALADTIWWSTDASNNPPVPRGTSKLPFVITAVIGLAAGVGLGALLFRRRARTTAPAPLGTVEDAQEHVKSARSALKRGDCHDAFLWLLDASGAAPGHLHEEGEGRDVQWAFQRLCVRHPLTYRYDREHMQEVSREGGALGAGKKTPVEPPPLYTPRQVLYWWHRKVVAVRRRWLAEVARSGTESPKSRALMAELDRLEHEYDTAYAYADEGEDGIGDD